MSATKPATARETDEIAPDKNKSASSHRGWQSNARRRGENPMGANKPVGTRNCSDFVSVIAVLRDEPKDSTLDFLSPRVTTPTAPLVLCHISRIS
jgi:hypothetical protein